MAKIETSGKWKFIGGRLCLDFTNTVGGRRDSHAIVRDKLGSYSDLLEWSRLAGAAQASGTRSLARYADSHRHDAAGVLKRAVVLREALYRIFKSVAEDQHPRKADLEILSRELKTALAHRNLARANGSFAWSWEQSDAAIDSLLWPVSLSAAELLTSDDLSRIRQCTGNDCGWMFLDTSRNRSRQWCDMRDCGNRAKVRRFRERLERSRRQKRP